MKKFLTNTSLFASNGYIDSDFMEISIISPDNNFVARVFDLDLTEKEADTFLLRDYPKLYKTNLNSLAPNKSRKCMAVNITSEGEAGIAYTKIKIKLFGYDKQSKEL